jgi:hypothetical protein
LRAGLPASIGDEPVFGTSQVVILFAQAAFEANLCYSLVYALEFLFGGASPVRFWTAKSRWIVLTLGLLLGVVFAFLAGIAIGAAQFPENYPRTAENTATE